MSDYSFQLKITQDDENEFFSRGKTHASFHSILLVVVTCIVAILNERSDAKELGIISMVKWSITPIPCTKEETKCIPLLKNVFINESDTCILNSNHAHYFYTSYGDQGASTLCNLLGKTPLFEREGLNLFSIINIPFLILSSQVIKTVFSLLYIREDSIGNTHESSSNVQKTLKKGSLLILITYAVTFLFMQNSWKIPGNNMFIVEIILLFAIFLIAFLPSSLFSENAKHQNMSLRFLEFTLTAPLLTVPVLAVSGNTSLNDMIVIFFIVSFTNAFVLLLELYKGKSGGAFKLDTTGGVLIANAWLCLLPFVIYCSMSISKIQTYEKDNIYSTWVLVSIIFLLVYEILYILCITIYNIMLYSEIGSRIMEYMSNITKEKSVNHIYLFSLLHIVLDIISVIFMTTIELCILCGAFVMVLPVDKTLPSTASHH